MKKIIFFLSIILIIKIDASSQVLKIFPENPTLKDTITIVFDATKGNKALQDIRGEVFIHTGLITDKSSDNSDWKYVVGNWGISDKNVLMKSVAKNIYSFKFTIESLYKPNANEKIQKLAFVFRNYNGSLVGKTEDNTDIIIDIQYPSVSLNKYKQKTKPSKLISYEQQDISWVFKTDEGNVKVTPFSENIIEVLYTKTNNSYIEPSHSVVARPQAINSLAIETQSNYTIQFKNFTIIANKEPFYLSFVKNGDTIMSEEKGFYSDGSSVGVRFKLKPNEEIYGTGERSTPMNRRNYKFQLYNRPNYHYETNAEVLNYSMPLIFSSENYAVLWDNPQKGTVDIGKTERNVLEWNAIGGPSRYYFIYDDNLKNIVGHYSNLTGKQEMPPRWALGNLQSRMAYRNQYETDSILNKMQKENFPVDAMIIDFYWFGDSIQGHLGKLDWYKEAWPNPKKMIKDFRKKGVNTIIITEPYIIDTVQNFIDAKNKNILVTDSLGNAYLDKNFYFGTGSLIDIFKPEAQEWFWEKYNKQIKIGIAGWWGDLGEPESHPSDIFHVNGKADEVHSIYGHYWDKMLYDKYAKFYPKTRLFHLQRSGYAGSQRYSAYPWTGDVARSWGGLQAQLPLLLTMSISGMGYIHSDAGGFALGQVDDELYTRWLQFAVFTPILRPHGSGIPSEPIYWSENTQNIVRNYMKIRYSLLPYNYTLAYRNSSFGEPLMAPLMYHYPNDKNARKIENQYMWGDQFLIVPIIEKGQLYSDIYLPNGKWYDFNSFKIYEGGKNINYSLSLDFIPTFVKEGSIIPMIEPISSTKYYNPKKYIIKYFPSKIATNYTQYEDDGKTRNANYNNNFELIKYQAVQADNNTFKIDISKSGSWKGMPKKRNIEIQIISDKTVKSIYINGKEYNLSNISFNQSIIKIPYLWKGNKNLNFIIKTN